MPPKKRYLVDPDSLTDEQILGVATQVRFTADFPYFAEKVLKVQTTKGTIEPFNLNSCQLVLHDIVENYIKPFRPVRIIGLKSRRMGFSTYFSGRYYWKTSRNPNRYTAQVTHEPEATDSLFKMVKRFYDFSPEHGRPETKYNNMRLLEFNTKDGRGLNSAFRVATAGKDDYGSGQLLHYLHLCMHPETPVLISNGKETAVKEVTVGTDLVTHNGNIGRVVAVSRRSADGLPDRGKMIVIHPWLGSPISVTPQHKVWTNMGWVQAGDLDPSWHMVSMPIREIADGIKSLPVAGRKSKYGPAYKGPTEFPLNEETGFAIGYYLAEGCISNTNGGPGAYHRITFTLHQNEDRFAERACRALEPYCKSPAKIKSRKGTLTKQYTLDSGVLAEFINDNFGCVDEKRIPDWVFECGEDFCRGVVVGYLAGDGSKGIGGSHQGYESNSITATSTRESITYQVRDLVASLGYGWGRVVSKPGGVFYGRNCRPAWTVYFNGECGQNLRKDIGIPYAEIGGAAERAQRYRLDRNNKKVWIRIKKIETSFCDEVYDLAIDHEDHSFRTPHFAVSNSEVAKWPKETTQSLLTSILQCVPDNDPDTEVIFESTAKGLGGVFYNKFWGSRFRIFVERLDKNGRPVIVETINEKAPKEDSYTSIFLPWFVFDEYRAKPPADFETTREERGLKMKYGLDDGQLYWRRLTIENKCDGSLDIFNQEYPACPMDAFLGTGSPVFDNKKLSAWKDAAPPPVQRYECLIGNKQWLAKSDGRLKVWEEPKIGQHYIVAADVAEGLRDGDFSSADVINHRTGKQVAQWHGKCDPDEFAIILEALGHRYNTAWLVPEKNNHGMTVLTVLNSREVAYPKIYAEMVPDPPGKPRKRLGWVTSNATRPMIVDNLIKEVREGSHGIQCAETFEEMMSFKRQDNGRMEADEGMHDDRVISIGIAKLVRQTLDLPVVNRADANDKKQRWYGNKRRKPNSRGWT